MNWIGYRIFHNELDRVDGIYSLEDLSNGKKKLIKGTIVDNPIDKLKQLIRVIWDHNLNEGVDFNLIVCDSDLLIFDPLKKEIIYGKMEISKKDLDMGPYFCEVLIGVYHKEEKNA